MKIFDYLINCTECSVVMDEIGNAYLDGDHGLDYDFSDYNFIQQYGKRDYFISKADCDLLNQCEITIDSESEDPYVRRPYYRMRGKPVTQEQAFDIIRRTDEFFPCIHDIWFHEEFVGSYHFNNWLINKNHLPKGYGWIHTDGTVGCNGITGKYPTIIEFAHEWIQNLTAFPYLDLMIAVTQWNEMPYELDDLRMRSYDEYNEALISKEFDSNFYNVVDTGMKKLVQVDLPYLKRCIESYGLDAEIVLAKLPEYTWK